VRGPTVSRNSGENKLAVAFPISISLDLSVGGALPPIAASKGRLFDCCREVPLFNQHVPADISAMNGTIGDTKHSDELAAAQDAAPLPSPKPASSNPGVEDLTTRALKFLSTASTETIGGIAVGLAACTYLILGRVGLVLIGALGGVVLHATWEGQSSTAGSIQDARRETGLEIVKRILDLREARRACEVDEDDKDVTESSFDGFQPETAAALNNLVDAVIRDYVKWWYSPILPVTNPFLCPMPRAPYFTGRGRGYAPGSLPALYLQGNILLISCRRTRPSQQRPARR